jgi:outer membrane protein TolC
MNSLIKWQFILRQKWRWLIAGSLALMSPLVSAQEAPVLDAAYLDALRWEVRTNHPSVAAAEARVQAADAAVRAVRLWEDPVAGVGVMAAERQMRADDGDFLFMAEQMLPRRKLYEARKTKAAAERSVFEAETRVTALTFETLVAQTAIELALTDELLQIETNQLVWLESMAANAREKLKDPAATAAEPLRIESELVQERQKIDARSRNRTRLVRQLNILLGRPPAEAWTNLRLPQSTSLAPALADEMKRLFQVNPSLQALLDTAQAAKSDLEVARRERSPAFSVGVQSSVYSGGDFRQATVTAQMTLPWFNKSLYRAQVERATRQQRVAEKEIDALHRKLRGEAVAAQTDAENAARQAGTFSQEIIPRTELAVASTQNAWLSSKASLLEVLEIRRALLNARLEERRFVAAHHAALEMLRSLVPPQTKP